MGRERSNGLYVWVAMRTLDQPAPVTAENMLQSHRTLAWYARRADGGVA
jgi:hypothetical protein